jgi:hypothetical protein
MKASLAASLFLLAEAAAVSAGNLLQPGDLEYVGAFRLPEDPGCGYSGCGLTYRPDGDPRGAADGFTGSLFIIGHDQAQEVAEIGIPSPASLSGGVESLPRAQFIQRFADVTGGMFGDLEIPRSDIEYLPDGGGTLWFVTGQHFQFETDAMLGLCEPDLSDPHAMGPWRAGDVSPYLTCDYLMEIPEEWSDDHLPGARLACGRFRDGGWGGLGPAMVALVPSEMDLPPPGGSFGAYPLLMYGEPVEGSTELATDPSRAMALYAEPDDWSGAAWLTAGDGASALVLVGTKAQGRCWYGYPNGVEYPTSGDPADPIPEMPPWPYDDRGWWAEDFTAGFLFYDPDDLAEVLDGRMETWEPQPYAFMDIGGMLADPGIDLERSRKSLLGACAFDRGNGILYVVERLADGDQSIIHAFRLRGRS